MVKKKAVPAPVAAGQSSMIHLKGTEAYRDWLTEFSKATHIPAAALVRLGLAEIGKKDSRPAPPGK